jgi:glycosyltransferase involved in cell wall biosynthesis
VKLAMVSTYPPFPCGIATYTAKLAGHLSRVAEVTVYSEGGAPGSDPVEVRDTYSRRGDYRTAIRDAIARDVPTIVHFQHAPDLYPDSRALLALMDDLRALGPRIFITLHTVHASGSPVRFYRDLARRAEIVVHSDLCRDFLVAAGVPGDGVHVVPHGTELMTLPDRVEARGKLGIGEDEFAFLFFGAIHAQKNLHTVVRAFRGVAGRSPRCWFVLVGAAGRRRWYNRLYTRACRALAGPKRNVTWEDRYVGDDEIPLYFGACDAILLPYWQRYASASGVLHLAVGAGRPVLCSDSPKFSEIREIVAREELPIIVPTLCASRWTEAMLALSDDAALRERTNAALREYALATTWEKVAARHLELFSAVA